MVGVFFYSNKKASPVKARLTNHNLIKKDDLNLFKCNICFFA